MMIIFIDMVQTKKKKKKGLNTSASMEKSAASFLLTLPDPPNVDSESNPSEVEESSNPGMN